jgi:DNA-binding CsgD family transcriptional regulator/tetratricopeptide (TPR) repeat protein
VASTCSSTSIGAGSWRGSGWPLVGRGDMLNAVASAITRRGPGGLVLSGRPGVGRSRLAHEALRSAQAAGFATGWFVATRAAASIPFGAFARLLGGFDLEGADRLILFLSAVEALAVRAEGRRLVLAVDDAHLLDQAGAALLHQVAATGTAFVVATVCTGETAPEPIAALGRDGLGARIEVPPLTAADFDRLLGAVLGGPVDGRTLHDLVASVRGSVSFLYELVAAGLESKALAKADGIWRWKGPLGSHPRVLAVVESHLGTLTPDERALLELLGCGEPLELALLERLVPARALESVERKGVLEVVQDNRRVSVRLAHPLEGEAIRATTPPLRVRAIRRRLASALRDTGGRRRGDVLRSAAWRLDGGEAVDGGELLAAAGEAVSCSDHALAAHLSRAAVASGSGLEARRLLSQALIRQGRLGEADALLRDPANPEGTEAKLAGVVLTEAVDLYLAMGVAVDAEDVVCRAEAMLFGARRDGAVASAGLRAELGVLLALRALTAGRPHEALRAAEGILQERSAGEPDRLRALVVVAMALAEAGRTKEALATVARATDLASRWVGELPQASLSLLVAGTVANRYAGNPVEAETLATAGYRRTLQEGNDAARTLWALLLGRVALDRGRVRTAARWFREGAALARAVSPPGQLPCCLAGLSIAAGQAGDPDTAAAALAEAEQLARPMEPLFESDLGLAQAWTAAACGETTRATKLALEAGDVAWERGQLSFAISAFHDAVRLGAVDEALRRMTDVVPAVDGGWAPTMLAHATALRAHDGPALDAVSAAFEGIGAALLAAEAATEAAVVHRRNGRLTSSLAASDRARALHGQCEGASTGAVEGIERDVLTRREREVAALAARGLSNRQMADLLVVSVRTIENQLHRVYGKLGVAGREELASALRVASLGRTPFGEVRRRR